VIEVGPNSYGKSAIRLVKVVRGETPHRVRDLTIAIALSGDFDASYDAGDNTGVVATDTMKNTAYALAGEHLTGSIEAFGLVLGRHFLAAELVHEALLTAWPRLVVWRGEDAAGARLRDQLRAAARQWQERGRPRGLLWRDDALAECQLWRARYPGRLACLDAPGFNAFAVALSGNTLVVGAQGEDSNATGINGANNNNATTPH